MARRTIQAIAGGAALVAVLLFGAAPAGASFDENTIGCSGSATIISDDGDVTAVDAGDATVKLPRSGTATWEGSIATVTHNHSGVVNLELGPVTFELGGWGPSENDDDENARNGVKEIPTTLGGVPPGKYAISGFHAGDEGRCSGSIVVEIEGNPLTNPAGGAAAVGTLITGGLLAMAGRSKGGVA